MSLQISWNTYFFFLSLNIATITPVPIAIREQSIINPKFGINFFTSCCHIPWRTEAAPRKIIIYRAVFTSKTGDIIPIRRWKLVVLKFQAHFLIILLNIFCCDIPSYALGDNLSLLQDGDCKNCRDKDFEDLFRSFLHSLHSPSGYACISTPCR